MAVSANPPMFITGVCLFALGCGYFSALRSLSTELVAPSQVGVLNTSIGLAQSVGGLVTGPAVAAALKRGIELGGFWTGLPYMIAALFFVMAAILSFTISVTDGSHSEEDDTEHGT